MNESEFKRQLKKTLNKMDQEIELVVELLTTLHRRRELVQQLQTTTNEKLRREILRRAN